MTSLAGAAGCSTSDGWASQEEFVPYLACLRKAVGENTERVAGKSNFARAFEIQALEQHLAEGFAAAIAKARATQEDALLTICSRLWE
ncbi:hypothetical protein JJQ59_27915 [Cupriavidus necator]|uniref:hypothetical protein n=1 Tax=Cupriavidus necator TaxID=106590 RepID=UPI0011BF0B42|nr:hypothetical protein [Cupriavidus necator]QQX86600.1 hypothetical protein JJQ59_27915 [Cupriavidus necator]